MTCDIVIHIVHPYWNVPTSLVYIRDYITCHLIIVLVKHAVRTTAIEDIELAVDGSHLPNCTNQRYFHKGGPLDESITT